MARWSVYKIEKHGMTREAIGLGYVNAPHQPAALRAAWKRWTQHTDGKQVCAGFSVRDYKSDPMSLGHAALALARGEGRSDV